MAEKFSGRGICLTPSWCIGNSGLNDREEGQSRVEHSITDLKRQMTPTETYIFRARLNEAVVHPYELRAERLAGLFNEVITVSLGTPENRIRLILGERIIDDISGTWAAMQGYAQALGGEIFGMKPMGQIVAVVCDALQSFYTYGDVKPLRALGERYKNARELPLPPLPNTGRQEDDVNRWIANRAEQLQFQTAYRRGKKHRQINWMKICETLLEETASPTPDAPDADLLRRVHTAITATEDPRDRARFITKTHHNNTTRKIKAKEKRSE